MMKRTTPVLLLVGFLCLGACGPQPDPPPLGAEAAPDSAAPDNHLDVPPSVRRNLGIRFVEVEARRVEKTLRLPGVFEYDSGARREYHMSLPGRVELRVAQYEAVEAGQILFRVQSPAWPGLLHEIVTGEQAIALARAEIEVARTSLEEARSGLATLEKRLSALASASFKKAELEARAAAYEASFPRLEAQARLAETRLANALRTREHALHLASAAAEVPEDELDGKVKIDGREVPRYETLDWLEVRAARKGVVEHLAATDGAYLEAAALVLTTVDPADLRFRAQALQADLPRLGALGDVRIVPPVGGGYRLEDGVDADVRPGLEAHPAERTLALIARPKESAPWVRAGVSAFLEVVLDATARPSLAIPRSAVVRDGLVDVFFRRDPDDPDIVVRVEADLGLDDGRWVVVESGLARGEEVVLEGAYELRLSSSGGGAGDSGGHVHADGTSH